MIFWRIRFDDNSLGWQILDDQLATQRITDADGNEMTGGFDYKFDSLSADPPPWFVDVFIPPEGNP
jgi:hypothetical protein